MDKRTKRWVRLSMILAVGLVFSTVMGCTLTGSKAVIKPSKQVERDFYTCRGFANGEPVDVTSEFDIRDNGLIYIVADLEKEQVNSYLDFELTSPNNIITYIERVQIKDNRPYGFYFDTNKMAQRGGLGAWKALFFADGQPVGRLYFDLIGEETEAAAAASTGGTLFERTLGEDAMPEALPEETIEEPSEEISEPVVEEGVMITPGKTWEEDSPKEMKQD